MCESLWCLGSLRFNMKFICSSATKTIFFLQNNHRREKKWLFATMRREKVPAQKAKWAVVNHSKSQSASGERVAVYLVELKGCFILQAPSADAEFKQVLFIINRLKVTSDEKPPEVVNRSGVVLHQDNNRPHISLQSQHKLVQLGWDVLIHPTYSRDIATPDYYLLLSL